MDIDGILNLNKPKGVTSFFLVNKIRKILDVKKAGHCGTLDPMATGVLVMLLGKATKLQQGFMEGRKVYKARILFGVKTDTADITGKVLEEKQVDPKAVSEKIAGALDKFKGDIRQVTPAYSAVKRNGRKMYELARKGITVTLPPRIITIYHIDVLGLDNNRLDIRVECSSGTYIRALAEDIGAALGYPATLEELVRERSGNFDISSAFDCPDDVKIEEILKYIMPVSDALLTPQSSPRAGEDARRAGEGGLSFKDDLK